MKNNDDQTVVQFAVAKKKDKIFELLLTRNDLNINIPIIQLIEENNLHNIEILLSSKNIGFDINAFDQQGNTALHIPSIKIIPI